MMVDLFELVLTFWFRGGNGARESTPDASAASPVSASTRPARPDKGCSSNRFAHLFSLLSWNLLCRSDNTERISFHHVKLQNDTLKVTFSHTKSDVAGDARCSDPKHVDANPARPEECLWLSLALYLCSYSDRDSLRLFPGNEQSSRARDALHIALKQPVLERAMSAMGWGSASDYGCHSWRKGATSFCFGGFAGVGSTLAVILRGGWSIVGAKERYIHWQAAADQFIGRLITGLPSNKIDFALLPPLFANSLLLESNAVQALTFARDLLFPALGGVMEKVPEFTAVTSMCVTQIIYRKKFLQAALPNNDVLHTNPLRQRRNRGLVDALDKHITGGSRTSLSDAVHSTTGIPPLTIISSALADIQSAKFNSIAEMQEALTSVLDENVFDGQTVSNYSLGKKFEELEGALKDEFLA
ncbi:hypothetical protein FVE85_8877 [Porphyridium purpureum]|uniref:Uncharacterized protein n=1 Tax=Porphyridium purpureum TaxID=35688 RepID=A0A5J4YRK0_PORPP|nr:hypothetical protein FVE85_8877 [Porphyridium purpureum]|eukprot:POR2174..scf296_7